MKTKNKILFRASGGKSPKTDLGMGHIYRCLNLANCLKNYKIKFLIENYEGAASLIKQRGYKEISFLKPGINIQNDFINTKKLIKKENFDLLIVDKVIIGQKYIKNIKKEVKTVVIADLKRIQFPSDLVISGFIGYKNGKYFNRFGTKCLLGPSFQILNKKFSQKNNFQKTHRLIATFGGYDEHNLIDKLLYPLSKNLDKIKTKVILGPATSKSKLVKILTKKFPNSLEIGKQTNDLRKEITSADFGICSGGLTSYEFANSGVPFAIICQHKHQLVTAREWQKLGIALNFGFPNKNLEKKIDKFLEGIIENNICLSKKGKKIVDGKGAMRVAAEIEKLLNY